ncbi:glycosyltransferase family 9 protein [Nocardioides sp. Kera G14]|uniref:glycosyltransferase family 9 protein n=1 Tax=Nocardioides sp. Kera G14 TaxID=2884264 RepID=UPI001D106355|nr:glycosyltransferase family 9 protein [Nocardioides sp. Kera G14]UDY24941.1 glycosyltransferase family 9 protein [Nocardioides sp. Kera G14]
MSAAGPRLRALVLCARGVGDLIVAVPAMRAMRRALPHHEIVLAAPEEVDALVELSGVADRLIPTAGLGPIDWTGAPPDVAVDLHGMTWRSKEPLQALSPERIVGYDAQQLPRGHDAQRWCRLVEEAFGVPTDPSDGALAQPWPPRPRSGGRPVVVHVGATTPEARWPATRFATVAWAVGRHRDVVLTGGETERARAMAVGALAGLPGSAVLAGRTDLRDLASLVAGAELVVTGDPDVAQLASAYRTPAIVVSGGPTPREVDDVLVDASKQLDVWLS